MTKTRSSMEKYYVTKDTRFVASHELSVSNSIIETEDTLTVLATVRKWVQQIFPTYIVYYKGNDCTVDMFAMYDPDAVGDKIRLNVVHTKFNVRFQIGIFKTEYKINKSAT